MSDEIIPAIIPLKFVILADEIPQIKPPINMHTIKIALTESDKISLFAKIYENTIVNITVFNVPTTADMPIPINFLLTDDVSFFFLIILRIKISLTFNKEYEG